MSATLAGGWLQVPFDGDELAPVWIGVSITTAAPTAWYPAFLDWDGAGQRVAQIRPPSPMPDRAVAWLRVGEHSTQVGRVR